MKRKTMTNDVEHAASDRTNKKKARYQQPETKTPSVMRPLITCETSDAEITSICANAVHSEWKVMSSAPNVKLSYIHIGGDSTPKMKCSVKLSRGGRFIFVPESSATGLRLCMTLMATDARLLNAVATSVAKTYKKPVTMFDTDDGTEYIVNVVCNARDMRMFGNADSSHTAHPFNGFISSGWTCAVVELPFASKSTTNKQPRFRVQLRACNLDSSLRVDDDVSYSLD